MITRRGFLKFIGLVPVAVIAFDASATGTRAVPGLSPASTTSPYPKAERLSLTSVIFLFGPWATKRYGLPPVVQYETPRNTDPYLTSITTLGPRHLGFLAEAVWLPVRDVVVKNRGGDGSRTIPSDTKAMMLSERVLMTWDDFKSHGLVRGGQTLS